MVFNIADRNAGLFHDFTPDCVFEAFTRLDKSCNRRIPARGPCRLTPKQRTLAIRHENDDGRIRAWELLMATFWVPTQQDVTGLSGHRRRSTAAAVTMPLTPEHHRACIGENAALLTSQDTRHRAQIHELRIRIENGIRVAGQLERETKVILDYAEQNGIGRQPLEPGKSANELSRES
jgi:hypothetical protein